MSPHMDGGKKMQRPIKFRAWDGSNIRTVEALEFNTVEGDVYYFEGGGSLSDKNASLMQFTGLTDRNGKEIYGGDILKIVSDNGEFNGQICSVVFERGGFRDGYYKWLLDGKSHEYEVIGNIYENASLLTKEKDVGSE